jgi:hypothetical protein
MSRQIACTRSTARAVVAFVSLVAIVAAVAAAKGGASLKPPLPDALPVH